MGINASLFKSYGFDMNEKFISILKTELEDYYAECYKCNKSLSIVHGEEIDKFIKLMPKVIKFFQKYLEEINFRLHYQTINYLSTIRLIHASIKSNKSCILSKSNLKV